MRCTNFYYNFFNLSYSITKQQSFRIFRHLYSVSAKIDMQKKSVNVKLSNSFASGMHQHVPFQIVFVNVSPVAYVTPKRLV